MPFPVDIKYIEETQSELGVIFPEIFIKKMLNENGGELKTDDDVWQLFPFFDKSDKKRISRTCNNIANETKQAREWRGFPQSGIAIATNGSGDNLVLMPADNEGNRLQDTIYLWSHETGELVKIADNIDSL